MIEDLKKRIKNKINDRKFKCFWFKDNNKLFNGKYFTRIKKDKYEELIQKIK